MSGEPRPSWAFPYAKTLALRAASNGGVERVRRLGFFSGLFVGLVVMGVAWLGVSGAFRPGSGSLGYRYRDIASIQIQPVPEGPPTPGFVPNPRRIDEQPLALLRDLVPTRLPAPLDRAGGCGGGGDVVIKLRSGKTLTYGPCRWPWQISELWGAMIETSDLTESNLILPNTPAAAEQEQVRQAVAVGIARGLIPHPPHYDPTMVDCQPAPPSGENTPDGYSCAVVLHSETSATGSKRMRVCAELSAGHLIHRRPQAGATCRVP
jgi:hypothetical protein